MKKLLFVVLFALMSAGVFAAAAATSVKKETVDKAIAALEQKFGKNDRIARGVNGLALHWNAETGTDEEFYEFAVSNFVEDSGLRELAVKLSQKFQFISGHLLMINRELSFPISVNTGKLTNLDRYFNNFHVAFDTQQEYYRSKVAHVVLLNFGYYTEAEKQANKSKWSLDEWGYAKLGDMFYKFKEEIKTPAGRLDENIMKVIPGDNEMYVNESTVVLNSLTDKKGKPLFTEDIELLFHWETRDYIKKLYSSSNPNRLEMQRSIYKAMVRYIDQTIPANVMNTEGFIWNPYTNEITVDGKKTEAVDSENMRYALLRNIFIGRYRANADSALFFNNFYKKYEMSAGQIEKLIVDFVSCQEAKEVADMVKKNLNRKKLEPFDLWYTGFDYRSKFSAEKLDKMVAAKFPTPQALQDSIPHFLKRLGFPEKSAEFYGGLIAIDPARGGGHAQPARLIGEKSRLRTNFEKTGLDYGGFETTMHEMGHNIQQTISNTMIDIFSRKGLPNPAATESAAYVFQSRAWDALMDLEDRETVENYKTLYWFWENYQQAGPALCEIKIWQWMYSKKEFSVEELKDNVLRIAKEVWNKYYYPTFGVKDEPVMATYNHMINNSLYLAGYFLAHLTHMQIERQIEGKDLQKEVERIYVAGNIPFDEWMRRATGSTLSSKAFIDMTREALDRIYKSKKK